MNNASTSDEDFNLIRFLVERECGISIGDDKKYLVENRLARLLVESGETSFGAFYRKLKSGIDPNMRDRIIDAMTTNETLWFRDQAVWKAMKDNVIPWLADRVNQNRDGKARIWSAASSTGQESYSLAMLLNEFAELSPKNLLAKNGMEILATDISSSSLFVAMSGRYDRVSMGRGLVGDWEGYRAKYFTESGRYGILSALIKNMVTFKKYNLQDSFSLFGTFDLIFLRNVAIYFSEDFKKELFERIAKAMKPGGLLVLGTAESILGYSKRFEAVHFGRAIFYRML